MPIRLTWNAPVQQGSGIIGYKLYKTINPGPISPFDFYQAFSGNVFLYDDYMYNRRILQEDGYLYRLTSLSTEGESDFSLSSDIVVSYSFEDFVDIEPWEFSFNEIDTLELLELWEYSFPTTPNLQYGEPWEYSIAPALQYLETWEYSISDSLQYIEDWDVPVAVEYPYVGSGGMLTSGNSTNEAEFQQEEFWEYFDLFTSSIVHLDTWEYSTIQFTEEIVHDEDWAYSFIEFDEEIVHDEDWDSGL